MQDWQIGFEDRFLAEMRNFTPEKYGHSVVYDFETKAHIPNGGSEIWEAIERKNNIYCGYPASRYDADKLAFAEMFARFVGFNDKAKKVTARVASLVRIIEETEKYLVQCKVELAQQDVRLDKLNNYKDMIQPMTDEYRIADDARRAAILAALRTPSDVD